MKRVLRILLLLILLALAAVGGYFFIETDNTQEELFAFVPTDFIYAVESNEPVKDWQNLSKTEIWQFLKGSPYFAEVSENADYLDSLLTANSTLVDFVELGNMVISAHMISRQDYDFVILVDLLGKGRKLTKLDPVMVKLFESLEYQVNKENYINNPIYNLYDPASKETLSISVVANVMIASYTKDLVKKAIMQSGNPSITTNQDFFTVRENTDRDDLYTMYLNYSNFNSFIGAFTTEVPELMADFQEVLAYSGFDLHLDDESAEFEGYTKQVDSVQSYLNVYKEVGQGRIEAHKVLPSSTAMYSSIGFDDFSELYRRFVDYSAATDPEAHEEMQKNIRRVEKLLKINFEEDFFSWMTEEVATAIVPVPNRNNQYSYLALMHFDDYDLTKEKLDHLMKQVKKRTPVKFKVHEYRGYEINYLALKGFFKLFFKRLFSRIEQPHFTVIDEYVVFSNDTTSLQYVIQSYLEQKTLDENDNFQVFWDNFESKANIHTYLQTEPLFNFVKSNLDYEARKDIEEDKPYVMSFPQLGFQMYPGEGMYKTYMYGEHKAVEAAEIP
ncbi:MAG: DUF3352 domain-containing protein [Bacteroidota bacterium]